MKLILPLLNKHNNICKSRLLELCHNFKSFGLRNDLNYESIKAITALLDKVEKQHPSKVRTALFHFLEKFTNALFAQYEGTESARTSQLGQLTNRSSDS